jgi:haloalkane dehalogenase
VSATSVTRSDVLRTPDERFAGLPGYAFAPHYVDVRGLRIHYVDEGPREARPVLLLHGEPSWSYLYRKMIPGLVAAGLRAVAPDLVGFGRSDKLARREDYSYALQVDVVADLVRQLGLRDAILFGQDWGGLVGLRVVAEAPERFAGVVVGNTALPAPEPGARPPLAFRIWRTLARWTPVFPVGRIVATGTVRGLAPAERAAYDAPFPSARYQAGARAMPALVPTTADDPATPANRRAWEVLRRFEKPFVTAFSDRDPITRGFDAVFQRDVPGARGQPHVTIRGAGHFLQEDRPDELVAVLVALARHLD